ncbi:MAG: DUF3014 domain-containing protein [Propionivibrio sp.]
MKNKYVWIVAVVVLAAFIAGFLWLFPERLPEESMSAPSEAIPVGKPTPAPAEPEPEAKAEPAIANPVVPEPTPEPLPKLDESEASIVTALGAVLDKSWMDVLIGEALIRKIVATVDQLPQPTLPANVVPVKRVSGGLLIQEVDGQRSISPHNAERYAEYMARIERLDAKKLVTVYRQYYPLFQKAYAEIAKPGAYFNDRLVQAIDNLLAAPTPAEPIGLVQPKVLYAYADPALDACSSGQKILMRMGKANAERVKAKLREIRALVVSPPGAAKG